MVGLDSYLITKNENLGGISSGFFYEELKKIRRGWIGFLLDDEK